MTFSNPEISKFAGILSARSVERAICDEDEVISQCSQDKSCCLKRWLWPHQAEVKTEGGVQRLKTRKLESSGYFFNNYNYYNNFGEKK